MNYQVISPMVASKIDTTVDFFIIKDHMPHPTFSSSQTLDDTRIEYFGKNTIRDLFIDQGLNYKDYFFIFDTYQNFDDFNSNGYFYPNFILVTARNYQKFSPQHSIDFTKKDHSVNCAMNKLRSSRVLTSCWFANNKVDRLLHTQSWANTDNDVLSHLDLLLQLGNLLDYRRDLKMLEQQWIESELVVLNRTESKISFSPYYRNEENFFNSEIKQLFDTTSISVVLEPVFWEHASIVCEKYIHAIYGGTIPLVSGYKIYDSLATLGFDTFSDIIDTSSQYEINPILRIWNMLEKNKNLFSQWQDLITDPQIQSRIINNLTLLQNPEQIFMNSLRLNSEQSLNKILCFKDSLKTYGFQFFDRLCITDKTK